MKLHRSFSFYALVVCLTGPLWATEKPIATFESEKSMLEWTTVNDGVMGGVSKGGWKRTADGTLLFSGELSLENNGGFSSIRTKQSKLGLETMTGIVVKMRGDGRTYWAELRIADQMGATSYRADLPTKANEWQEITLPISSFKLQAFGRELPAKPIRAEDVASIGFTLADKKAGPFSLEIARVVATDASTAESTEKAPNKGTIVEVAKAAGSFKTLIAAATAAGLAETLTGEGPFTVLAPTDEAFAKLPEGTVEALLRPENKEKLVDILKNHVVAGKVSLAEALAAKQAASLQGSPLTFQFSDAKVKIGKATLLKADVPATNGVIHVIDEVLLPEPAVSTPLSASGLIELAIERGVPLFNSGEVSGCAALYELTCQGLRGSTEVPEDLRDTLKESLKSAAAESSDRKKAWILREALDCAWEKLQATKTPQ